MADVPLKNILDASFRANPEYDLTLFDRLPPGQQDTLRDLTKDPDFYGVLLPKGAAARTAKSVCRDTALLLFSLKEPGPLPGFVRAALGQNCNLAIAELVLDGVLQIERGGTFVSGFDAHDFIHGERPGLEPQGAIARLTRAALEYGQNLDIDDNGRLAARLYFYNRVPVSTAWTRRFPSQDAVAGHLGIENGGARRSLGSGWSRMKPSSESDGWFKWVARTERITAVEAGAKKGYKLYLSPRPEYVRDAFQVLLESLADSSAHHFKVGSDAAGLLRPDKMVVYFPDLEGLQHTAERLGHRLTGCAAQGVPFTADFGNGGLLSWGVDPAAEKGTLSWQEHPSWRLWVTNRLATALVAAKRARSGIGVEPWRFALERLRLENVDTDTWTPLEGFGESEEATT